MRAHASALTAATIKPVQTLGKIDVCFVMRDLKSASSPADETYQEKDEEQEE
jgi:hypothetical protein